MESGLAPETPQQTDCKPCVHELLVRNDDDSSSYGYLVVEVTRSCFREACKYLHDTRWLDSDLVPLVLSNFSLSECETQMLPRRVPWLQAMSDVGAQLHTLHTALVVPLERRGLICVDFGELVVALANGGEARLAQASGRTASLACDGLFADEKLLEWLSATTVAVCLHIHANPGFTMSEFDLIGQRLEPFMAQESLVIISTNAWDGDEVELTLLAVLARR